MPNAGGIYDQSPEILDKFMFILGAQAEEREKKEASDRRKQGGPSSKKKK